MRIAYICADPGVPVFGSKGSSVHVQEVLRALVRRGAQITLLANRFDGDVPAGLDSISIQQLPRPPKGNTAERERQALLANDALRAALISSGPFDLIYERYSLWSYAGMEFARTAGIPGVLEVNAPLIDEQATHRELVNRASAEQVAEQAFRSASVLTAVSTGVASWLQTYPQTAGKVEVLPNGVDPRRFPVELEPAVARTSDSFIVGFVGTLKPWHGLPVLVDAFERLHALDNDVKLLVIGDGTEREAIEDDIRSRGLDTSTLFTGAVAPETVPSWLASMDVGVAPYPDLRDFYFSPLKVFEYMAAGLPVVASDIGQIPEFVRSGETGLLVPAGDAVALAGALDALRRDREAGARLGAAGRRFIFDNHTWDHVVERVHRLSGLASGPPLPVGVAGS